MRKRVLVIAMIDSIHVGRWLEQFLDQEIDFVLFPSKKFRKVHPRIKNLLTSKSPMKVNLYQGKVFSGCYGYLDFALRVLPKKFLKLDMRYRALRRFIYKNKFDYIHCLEIQGAGYLLSDAIDDSVLIPSKIIVTNWGSDIYYFKEFKDHEARIRKTLAIADYYSAECIRDYRLARELGFKGADLPCIPNAGGFSNQRISMQRISASKRQQIVVKCYGGQFGRGKMALSVVSKVLEENAAVNVFFYSVTEDLIDLVKKLEARYQDRINYSTVSKPLPSSTLETIFDESRVYIGCSVSDGISTSFLESLISGSYPIQTNTSCANEWVAKGCIASVIELDEEILREELNKALYDDELVDRAQLANLKIAQEFLAFSQVKAIANQFYVTDII